MAKSHLKKETRNDDRALFNEVMGKAKQKKQP
jgi:hypothetical protein